MQTRVYTSQSRIIRILSTFTTKRLFYMFAVILVGIFVLYAYLVNRTVMNVVAREQSEHQIASLSGTVGQMEFDYMALKSKITLNLAYQNGFQDATALKFLDSNSKTGELSYNYH